MTKTRKTLVALIAAATLASVGSAAQAHDHGYGYGPGPGPGYGYGPRTYGPGYGRPVPAPQPYYQPRRNRTGENIAKGVAIGVGAVILGSILANEARRHHPGY